MRRSPFATAAAITLCAVTLLLMAPAQAQAQDVPGLLSHQGRILDADNNPLTGIQELTFVLYDGMESSTVLWNDTISLAFDNGYYTVTLGRNAAIPSNIFDGSDLYLGITVGSDTELRPRLRIASVPYAFKANTAENATGDITPNSVSVGDSTVIDEDGQWVGDPTGLIGPEGPEGPAGADADVDDVAMALVLDETFRDIIAQILVDDFADALRGPAGADGAPGMAGADGAPGTPGADGAPGMPGADGAAADPDEVAMALALDTDFRDAIAALLVMNHADALRGPAGADGAPGAPGAPGADGPPGADGKPSGGLVVQLEFDEENGTMFADTSVLGNDASTPGGGLTAGAGGHTGNAVDFSGGIVTIPAGNTIPDSAQIWVETWINPDVSVVTPQVVLQKEGAYTLSKVEDGNSGNSNAFQASFSVAGRLGVCAITHPQTFVAGEWTHVAAWYTNLRVEIAVNGQTVSSNCANGAVVGNEGNPLYVGARLSGGNRVDQYDGRIDEIRVRQTAPVVQGNPTSPFRGSSIINATEQVKINGWTGKPSRTWRRCYELDDGNTANNTSTFFHSACDNRGPTMTIFEMQDGRVFGGYTTISWTAFGNYRGYEHDSFLFVLRPTIERFPIGGDSFQNSIYDTAGQGPTFGGGHDINVIGSVGNPPEMRLRYCNFPTTYSCDGRSASAVNECSQRLCGINSGGATQDIPFANMEVWVLED